MNKTQIDLNQIYSKLHDAKFYLGNSSTIDNDTYTALLMLIEATETLTAAVSEQRKS